MGKMHGLRNARIVSNWRKKSRSDLTLAKPGLYFHSVYRRHGGLGTLARKFRPAGAPHDC